MVANIWPFRPGCSMRQYPVLNLVNLGGEIPKGEVMLRRLSVLVVMAVATVFMPAVPASAAWSSCPAGKFCVWTGRDGAGVMATFSVGDADLSSSPGPSGMNNNIRSAYNKTSTRWCLYSGRNYSGTRFSVPSYNRYNVDPIWSSVKPC
jgi:hypothetical protein